MTLIEHLRSKIKSGLDNCDEVLEVLDEWESKGEIISRSDRLNSLLLKWHITNKKLFQYDELIARHKDKGHYLPSYTISIRDGDTVILHTAQKLNIFDEPTPWRTSIYDESYSDRIDGLMDALERAISFEENRF